MIEKLAPVASLDSVYRGLEQGWWTQYRFRVTGWGIIFIWGMVLWCDRILKPGLSLDQLQKIWQPLSYIADKRR